MTAFVFALVDSCAVVPIGIRMRAGEMMSTMGTPTITVGVPATAATVGGVAYRTPRAPRPRARV
jgi:hypothetical protein